MIRAGDVYHARLKGFDHRFTILSSPAEGDCRVVFILGDDFGDPFFEPAGDLEKIIGGRGCRKAWSLRERLSATELDELQTAALDSEMGEYFKRPIRRDRDERSFVNS